MWRTVVGQQIRDKRVSVKMTQADVAGWLGWSRTTLVAIEAGGQSVSLDQLFRLSALFDCHVADLLPGELAGYGRQRY
jgi:DNA-binding XRE family transcriptional regulator